MKRCTYCGEQYSDELLECSVDHHPLEIVMILSAETRCVASASMPRNLSVRDSGTSRDLLVRDRPKFVIVVGIWLIYGFGLVINVLTFIAVVSGAITGILGFVCLWLSIGCGALCAYLLQRVVKNYIVQKRREANEAEA